MCVVEDDRRLKDIIMADLLRCGLNQEQDASATVHRRVKLPLVQCAHEARPGEEVIPERVAKVLLEGEAGVEHRPLP
jgi:hypothetical protein